MQPIVPIGRKYIHVYYNRLCHSIIMYGRPLSNPICTHNVYSDYDNAGLSMFKWLKTKSVRPFIICFDRYNYPTIYTINAHIKTCIKFVARHYVRCSFCVIKYRCLSFVTSAASSIIGKVVDNVTSTSSVGP